MADKLDVLEPPAHQLQQFGHFADIRYAQRVGVVDPGADLVFELCSRFAHFLREVPGSGPAAGAVTDTTTRNYRPLRLFWVETLSFRSTSPMSASGRVSKVYSWREAEEHCSMQGTYAPSKTARAVESVGVSVGAKVARRI